MFLLEINYKLLYYVYYAGDGLDYSLAYWTSLGGLSVEGDKHFSRGQAVWFLTSDPAHCQGGGGADLSAVSFPWSEHSALRLATSLSRCFSVNLCHQVLKWDLLACEKVAEDWTSAQTCMDSLACRGPQQFPANLFVLYCTHQVPVSHHPLSSIAMEKPCWCMYLTSVQTHLFEKQNETLTYLEWMGSLCLSLNSNA